jgi:hypothetical protein
MRSRKEAAGAELIEPPPAALDDDEDDDDDGAVGSFRGMYSLCSDCTLLAG